MTLTEYLAADPARCAHGYHRTAQTCPECGKSAGLAAAETGATEDERARIDAAIARLAASGGEWSANDLRAHVPDVTGAIMGARFSAAAKAGLIRDTGKRVPSTLGSTHAHEVRVWVGAA